MLRWSLLIVRLVKGMANISSNVFVVPLAAVRHCRLFSRGELPSLMTILAEWVCECASLCSFTIVGSLRQQREFVNVLEMIIHPPDYLGVFFYRRHGLSRRVLRDTAVRPPPGQ